MVRSRVHMHGAELQEDLGGGGEDFWMQWGSIAYRKGDGLLQSAKQRYNHFVLKGDRFVCKARTTYCFRGKASNPPSLEALPSLQANLPEIDRSAIRSAMAVAWCGWGWDWL